MMHFIVEAQPKENYVLALKFRNGEVRLLDMTPYIQKAGCSEDYGRKTNSVKSKSKRT